MNTIQKKKKQIQVQLSEEVLECQREKNQAAIRLLREWLADESGYDIGALG